MSPELEEKLRESITRRDAQNIRQLLADAFAPTVEALLQQKDAQLSDREFEAVADQLVEEFIAYVASNATYLSDYAVSRESIYEVHP